MSQSSRYSLLFAGLGLLFFVPFLGAVRLFDWDEVNFAECAREMLVLNDYLRVHIDFQPFWEKPPLFFWFQTLSMRVFGVGEYAARFPNALCGVVTLVYLYRLGRRLHGHTVGWLWALAWLGSLLPHLYFRSGIIDPLFNLFIFSGLVELMFAIWARYPTPGFTPDHRVGRYLLTGGLLLGLAILTKGPVAALVVGLTVGIYGLSRRFRAFLPVTNLLFYGVMALLVPLLWYGVETWAHGPRFINEFIRYNIRLFTTGDAGHSGFPGYHVVVLLVGCFPASLFALRAFGVVRLDWPQQRDFRQWMLILFWVVLVLFSVVGTKIVHYSSLCYYPVTYLAALILSRLLTGKLRFAGWLRAGVLIVGLIWASATLALPVLGQHIGWLKSVLKADPFTMATLDARVVWTNWQFIPGVWLLLVLGLSVWWFRNQPQRAVLTLFGGVAVFLTLTLWQFINPIEEYAQGSAMRYYQATEGRDVYVHNFGYRSYAPYFYPRKRPLANPLAYQQEWLVRGPIDKPVYFITKITEQAPLDSLPDVRRVATEAGYSLYLRMRK